MPVPLVLHGASGVPDADLVAAVRAGMTKVNIATHLNNAFTTALREHLAEDQDVVDTRRYLGTARDAVAAEAAGCCRCSPCADPDNEGMVHGPEETVAFRLWPPVAIGAPLLAGWLGTLQLG